MRKVIYTTVIILFFTLCTSAQTQCASVEDCNGKLSEAAKMISKLLDINSAQDKAIEALKTENAARARKNEIDTAIIGQQDKLILLLEKKSKREISVLFGLVKIRF